MLTTIFSMCAADMILMMELHINCTVLVILLVEWHSTNPVLFLIQV